MWIWSGLRNFAAVITIVAFALINSRADAGPPYVTDDPAPTDYHHCENFHFVDFTHVPDSSSGAAGLDLNYGAAENLQLTLVLPAEFEHIEETHWQSGDPELAAKYRLLRSTSGSLPDIAIFPRLFVPTHQGEASHLKVLLPVWLGKDHEAWSWFGGGGYLINPGQGNLNVWLSGVAITRAVNERLHLGMEIYHQTPQTGADKPFTAINAGVEYRFNRHWLLLASFGPGIQHAREEGQYNGYLAFKVEY